MTRLEDVIVSYAKYHRDPRNIATHAVGIPTIVYAVLVLLSRGGVKVGNRTLTPAQLVYLLSTLYYLSLDAESGVAMGATNGLLLKLASSAAEKSTPAWLATGIGAFAGGWVVQFIGHAYEGRKPAFIDDLKSLAIGPLFVVVEALFAAGRKQDLLETVDREAGPVVKRQASAA